MFDSEIYVERRTHLQQQLESGLLFFLGNEESPRNYADNPYHFRQDSTFLYYWGLDAPDMAAIIDLEEGREVIYGRAPTLDEIVWTGPQPSLQEKARRVGVGETGSFDELAQTLQQALRQDRTVHFLPQYRAANRLKMQDLLGLSTSEINDHVSEPLIRAIVDQRSAKSNKEIEQIEQALDVSYEMHTLAMRRSKPGVVEQEIAGNIEGVALAHGGGVAFPVILSVHGEVMHNHGYGNRMEPGDLVLCDAGAASPMHYASDITRTTPVSGQFSERQKEMYQIVLEAQERAIEAVHPGVTFKEIHLQAARDMTARMKECGFMKGDVEEAVAAGAHAIFFQTGLGHMMGLDVHDMEALGEDYVGYDADTERSGQFGLRNLRLARALEPGFVLTVEPGVYFIPELIDQWRAEGKHAAFINYDRFEQYKDFRGIRIEDDVLVTEDGCRVLGKPIPKTVEDVEAMAANPVAPQI